MQRATACLRGRAAARPCGRRRPGSSPRNTRRISASELASRLARAGQLCRDRRRWAAWRMVGRRGDRQHPADRLDPVVVPCSSMKASWLEPAVELRLGEISADALRRISLAWRSSRFSRSSALIRSRSSVVTPARTPLSTSGLAHPFRSVCGRAADLGRNRHRSPPTASGTRHGAPAPSAPRAHAPQGKTCWCLLGHGSILSRVGASGKPGGSNTRIIVSIRDSTRQQLTNVSELLNSDIDKLKDLIQQADRFVTSGEPVPQRISAQIAETIRVLKGTWPSKRSQIDVALRKLLVELGLVEAT